MGDRDQYDQANLAEIPFPPGATGRVSVLADSAARPVPNAVETSAQRGLYALVNAGRRSLKITGETIDQLRRDAAVLVHTESLSSEVVANITLAYRHIEDASMRLGKALQALDGGVSVYDRDTTVGA